MVNHRSSNTAQAPRPLLARLAGDRSGNVLALAAACIPPVLILVGGGVDMSRAYMTQTSLQNACDAGVLAGRRAQAKSGSWTATEIAKAQKMFTFNFQGTSASATGTVFTPTNAGSGVVSGVATTTMPTVMMQMFGTPSFALRANCSAELQLSNIDVMFVLDTTGSMACDVNGNNCNSGSTSKIYALKEAIRQFYYTIAASVPSGSTVRVRFGFVPYAGTVNIGGLVAAGDIPSSYLSASTNYQTKLANFTTVATYTGTAGSPVVVNATSNQSNSSNCNNWANAAATTSGSQPNPTTRTTYAWVSYSSKTNVCTRSESTTTTTYTPASYKFTDYTYQQDAVDTSAFRAGTAITIADTIASNATVPTQGSYNMVALGAMSGTTGITTASVTWGGCVEERNSVNSLFTSTTPPTGAYDHDLASAPSNAATTWHPFFDVIQYNRGQAAALTTGSDKSSEYDREVSGSYRLCVPKALKFTTVDTSAPTTVPTWIETFLGTLVANGNTYHDIGMLWGARLANPSGIMSANVTAGNLTSVSRHIIMLTDGLMSPNYDVANSYGIEQLDNRVAPSGTGNTSLTDYHNARFLAACQTAKNMGYTIWFIGFGQTLSTQMTSCATGGRAYYASDTTTLQNTFRAIGSQVADLRLKS